MYVGNNSGLMHLAAATGIPTLGLFGPTPMAQYTPVGRCASAVRGGETMEALTVDAAFAEVERLLAAACSVETMG